jgi:hypothetical protein
MKKTISTIALTLLATITLVVIAIRFSLLPASWLGDKASPEPRLDPNLVTAPTWAPDPNELPEPQGDTPTEVSLPNPGEERVILPPGDEPPQGKPGLAGTPRMGNKPMVRDMERADGPDLAALGHPTQGEGSGELLTEEEAPWPGEETPKTTGKLQEVEPAASSEPQPPATQGGSEVIDPREAERMLGASQEEKNWNSLSPEEKLEKEHEPTNLSVQRTFIATLPNGEKQTIRIKIPVVYQSRLLRLNPEDIGKARSLATRGRALETKLAEVRKEAEVLLKDWNDIVRRSTPRTALLPESSSLPENQSSSELNREGMSQDLVPGKPAQMEIQKPKS